MQLLRLMNKQLDRHADSRRRMLAWHTPVMIPVWQQVGRVECSSCFEPGPNPQSVSHPNNK
jgi:hypothetical protein